MSCSTKDKKNKYDETNKVVIQYLPAVRATAFRLKERLPSSIDVNDLIAIGIEEMVKLSRRYDVEKNNSFWGYAKKRVYGSMLDYLRSLDVVSRNHRRVIKAIELETSKYLTKHSREPSERFLAHELGESIKKIREAKQAAELAHSIPLNEQIVDNPNECLEDKVEQDQMIDIIKNILTTLSEREQIIIQLYYFEELNLKEISQILDISESRISQLHKKLMKQIKSMLIK